MINILFLGYGFTAGKYSLDATPTSGDSLTALSVGMGEIDELYGTRTYLSDTSIIPETWDFNTILHALFEENLLAGNIRYYVSEIDKFRLKRRVKGSLDWIVLAERTVSTLEDMFFDYYDKTARSTVEYEYTLVPVMGGIEGVLYKNTITAKSNGIVIADATGIYHTDLEVKITEKQHKQRNVVTTIGRRYPYVVSNGMNNYQSGSISGFFVSCENGEYDTKGGHMFRRDFRNFLNNNMPKIIKADDGRMWLVEVSSSDITDTEQGHYDFVTTSFDWTEVGDCDSYDDLLSANLIDGGG